MSVTTKQTVLFLCTGNSARSQMAEGFMNYMKANGGRFQAFSAGSHPAGFVHPLAIAVMREMTVDISGQQSKSWDDFRDAPFDFVITVCDRAAAETCPVWPSQPITAHWNFEDPAAAVGSDEEKYRVFKRVAIEIQRRVELFFALPAEKIDRLKLQEQVRAIGGPLPPISSQS
jgi:arsenate reductase